MKKIISFVTMVIATLCAVAQESEFPDFPGAEKFALWPDGAPTANGYEGTSPHVQPQWADHVSVAELYVYPAPEPNGQVVLASPGGGYGGIAYRYEGHDFAKWLNDQGITLAVLHYRDPNHHKELPLEDGSRAIEIIRRNAGKWGADPNQIGVMGFSAGGHFAATLATLYRDKNLRPAFQILFYPVITFSAKTHGGTRDNLLGDEKTPDNIFHYSLENQVNEQTPPAFLILASDDKTVPPVNSYNYAAALTDHKVPVSMVVFPRGDHGFGFNDSPYKSLWQKALAQFLAEQRPAR